MTEVFANLGRIAARSRGYPALRILVLPHPMESRSEEEVRAIARARFAELAALLTETDAGSTGV